ncbi:ubiquitin-conjugating enzyme E2-17 kDa-like [Phalaenopsis equestris]|uniref:ubiquitin-conjugating enzyme E2-17 kDa-like n=1 Tax=Phalaenopsis equestris TaxID=78828 RepID=UPI0009E5FF5E|nr:ubiquitin-conjugating enzyme E2-17 kDa-like [Phalaenopsis equestris]
MASRRIQFELNSLRREPQTSFTIREVSEDLLHLEVTFIGPLRTPFDGGVFRISIDIPSDYPFEPPEIHFITRVFHPNINRSGIIFPNIIRRDWTPTHTISRIIPSIRSFLVEPILHNPSVPEIAQIYENDRVLYEVLARSWTLYYAKEDRAPD